MKAGRPSSTSLLIARGLVLADATPSLRPFLMDGSATLSRKLLDAEGRSSWFNFALRHRFAQKAILLAEKLLLPGILLHWILRKRVLDTFARQSMEAGCRQLVVLGAGLDALAWRLQFPGGSFELDHPDTQAIKRRVFEYGPVLVPIDLLHTSINEALRAQPQFVANQPTLFVAEGLLMYLPIERVAALFGEVAALSAPGSRFAFTFMEARPGRPIGFRKSGPGINWWLRRRGEPFRWAVARADVGLFATRHGWKITEVVDADEMRRRFLTPLGMEGTHLASGESVALAHRCEP